MIFMYDLYFVLYLCVWGGGVGGGGGVFVGST